jgi:hypothetical protein
MHSNACGRLTASCKLGHCCLPLPPPPSSLPLGPPSPLGSQACHKALVAWRAEAAAAGSLPVLSSLSQGEVSWLTDAQAQAVGRAVMQLEAGARLLVRQAAAGGLDLARLTPPEAQALAWRVHTGGVDAAEEVVQLVLMQVRVLELELERVVPARTQWLGAG